MNVTCPNCATIYRVDPAKVPEGGVRARCSVCSAVFAVKREGEEVQSPPRPTAKETVATTGSKPQPVAEAPRPAPPSFNPGPAAPAAAGPAGSPPRPMAPQKPAPGAHRQPDRSSPGSRSWTAHAGPSRYSERRPRSRRCRRHPLRLRLVLLPRQLKRHRRHAPKPATPPARPISSFSAAAVGSGAIRCPAAESIPLSGSGAQGKAVGPGADLRYGRLPSGQAAGGTSRRKSQGTVRGGDQKELGGVRGTGRARDCRFHGIFPGGVERDPGGWAANFLRMSSSH